MDWTGRKHKEESKKKVQPIAAFLQTTTYYYICKKIKHDEEQQQQQQQQQEDTDAQVHSDSGRKTGVSTVGLKRKVHEGGNNAGLHNVSKRQRAPDNSFGRTTGQSSRHDSESEDLTSEEKRAIKELDQHSLVGYLQRNREKSAAILRFWDEVVESRSVPSCSRSTGLVGKGSMETKK